MTAHISVPDRFVAVGEAARLCQLRTGDPLQVCCYPSGETWDQCRGVASILAGIEQAVEKTGIVLIVGLTGTGKTFHLLLWGHLWETKAPTLPSWNPFRRPERHAFYGVASALDFNLVEDQWTRFSDDECLWLVDDLHHAIDTCDELIKLFSGLELAQAKHVLVFAGWSRPKALGNVPTVPITLTSESIELALRAYNVQIPSKDEIEKLAAYGGMGLPEIMWVGIHFPKKLKEAPYTELQRLFVSRLIASLNDEAKLLAGKLARLRFLGVPLPLDSDPQLWGLLQRLKELNLTTEVSKGWELGGDALARALLVYESLQTAPDLKQIVSRFLSPIQSLAEERLAQRSSTFLIPLLFQLRDKTVEQLCEWLGTSILGTADPLLNHFLAGSSLAALPDRLADAEWPLPEVGRLVSSVAHQPWAARAASEIVTTRREELTDTIRKGNIEAWRTGEVLARLTADAQLLDVLFNVDILRSKQFLESLRSLGRSVFGHILRHIKAHDSAIGANVERSLLPADGQTLAKEIAGESAKKLWRRLDYVAQVDIHLATAAVEALPNEDVAKAALSAPTATRKFCGSFHRELARLENERVYRKLAEALMGATITEEHVREWASPHDLISMVELSKRTRQAHLLQTEAVTEAAKAIIGGGNPAPIVDLCRPVARWPTCPLREGLMEELERLIPGETEPFTERLHCLTQLDRERASIAVTKMLPAIAGKLEALDDRKTFWLLWTVLVALPTEYRGYLGELAQQVLWSRQTDVIGFVAALDRLSLSGLAAFIARSSLGTPITLPEVEKALRIVQSSPVILACQLYAIARGQALEQRQEYLAAMLGILASPPVGFRRSWHRHGPPARRLIVRVVFASLVSIYQDSNTRDLARTASQAIAAQAQDDVWDDNIQLRFTIALRFGGPDCAAELLERRGPQWVEKVGSFLSKPQLAEFPTGNFLWSVAALAKVRPNVVTISLPLLTAANAAIEVNEGIPAHTRIAFLVAKHFVEGVHPFEGWSTPLSTLDGSDIPSPLVRVLYSVGLGLSVREKDMDILRSQMSEVEYQTLEDLVAQQGLS